MRQSASFEKVFKIFVVDDDENLLLSIQDSLPLNYQVSGCTNPIEALEILKEEYFDLLISDFQMYPINGDEFVSRVREFNSSIYILFLTGYADAAPAEEMFDRLDIQGYCDKGSLSQLKLWIESSRKIVTSNKRYEEANKALQISNSRFEEMNIKLKKIIDFCPLLYSLAPPDNVLSLVIKQTQILFEVQDVFILIDDIVNMKYGNKHLFKGSGKFAMDFDAFCVEHRDSLKEVGEVMINKQKVVRGNYMIFPFNNRHFHNVGIIYIEQYNFDAGSQVLEIFLNQLNAALEEIFLYQLSVTDELTGVNNRIFVNNYLMNYVFENHLKSCSVLFLDIDNFKNINDTYGYNNGDLLLRYIAGIIKNLFKNTEIIARYGSDEFVVVIPDWDISVAKHDAERLRKIIEADLMEIPNDGREINVTVSIGVCTFLENDNWGSLLERAEKTMYLAKQQGKNRICLG